MAKYTVEEVQQLEYYIKSISKVLGNGMRDNITEINKALNYIYEEVPITIRGEESTKNLNKKMSQLMQKTVEVLDDITRSISS